jgi:hypothetical protein
MRFGSKGTDTMSAEAEGYAVEITDGNFEVDAGALRVRDRQLEVDAR